MGEVQRRVSTCRYSGRPVFVRVLALFPFSFPLRAAYTARVWVSVYVCPVCITMPYGLREAPSRLGLHNNALSLRESTSQLGLHNNALDLRENFVTTWFA